MADLSTLDTKWILSVDSGGLDFRDVGGLGLMDSAPHEVFPVEVPSRRVLNDPMLLQVFAEGTNVTLRDRLPGL